MAACPSSQRTDEFQGMALERHLAREKN